MTEVAYTWDLFLPGQDLPRRFITGSVLSEGELLSVDGRTFLVEQVVIPEDEDDGAVPVVHMSVPHEPEF
jgi:hypothetical protein